MTRTFPDFESLESFLAGWTSWRGDDYDFGGAVVLLRACLKNIAHNAIQGDWESLSGRLDASDKEVLQTVVGWMQKEMDSNE